MKAQIKKLKERVTSETPTHFVRTRNIGLGLLLTGIVLKGVGIIFPPLLPVTVISFASDLIGYGTVIAGLSQTAKK
jgi:hypothetical protein